MIDRDPKLPSYLLDHRDAIRRYILSLTKEPAEADDLTQETYLRAHAGFHALKSEAKALPWLYRIATHVSYDRFRQASYKQSRRATEIVEADDSNPSSAASIPDDGPRLDLAMEQDEMSGCVQQYVAQLSDQYRSVILLHDTQGLTNPEIAEMLDLSLATVKIRLHRARKRLRDALDRACSFSHDERGVLICEPKPGDGTC
jgi:RNA polymerase sigma-70 factor (ECF subfamily)